MDITPMRILTLTRTPTDAIAGGGTACASATERARGVGDLSKPAPHAAALLLSRGAWPRLQRLMPAVEVNEFRRDRNPRRLGEIERDKAGNVGDGEALAGDERPAAQGLIDNRHRMK